MVIQDRAQGEQSILEAGEAILELMRSSGKVEFNPTDLVREVAHAHDRYSARAALLHLLEKGLLVLSSNWNVKLVDSRI
jgi:hypothetical protein